MSLDLVRLAFHRYLHCLLVPNCPLVPFITDRDSFAHRLNSECWPHHNVYPPSITQSAPVMNPLASLAK